MLKLSSSDKYNRSSYIDFIDERIMNYVRYPGYECRYPALSPLRFSRVLYDEMREVSEKLFKIFVKACRVFQNCPWDFMRDMDMPEKIIPYLNVPNALNLPTWLSRFDYVLDGNMKLKMVEINADTPCAMVESYYGNKIAADFFGLADPNCGEYEKLQSFMLSIVNRVFNMKMNLSTKEFIKDTFLFSCFHDYIEDYGNTVFLLNTLAHNRQCEVKFASFYDLAVADGFIQCPDFTRPKLIYRLHPMELLIEEKATDKSDLGILFMEGYKDGKFQMMNPPEAIIMQSKGFLALIYALAETNNFFTPDEIDLINTYIPPSYFETDAKKFTINRQLIEKPIWGREGNGIKVIDANANIVLKKELEHPENVVQRDSDLRMYQEFIRQPKFTVKTDYAKDLPGYVTLSCFMLGDKASAVYGRFSYEAVAGTEAFWVPLLTE